MDPPLGIYKPPEMTSHRLKASGVVKGLTISSRIAFLELFINIVVCIL